MVGRRTLAELFERGLFIAVGIVLLLADGLRNLFVSVVGGTLAIGPVIAIGPVETILKVSTNRLTRRVVGKDVFQGQQEDTRLQVMGGQNFGSCLQRSTQERDLAWSLARDFTLTGEEDWKSFPMILKTGQAVKGYIDAEGRVWAYIITASSFNLFEREDRFRSLWEAPGENARVDFVPERSGIYYVVVASFDPATNSPCHEEDDDVFVELRLKF